jgi:heme/copper-type cytochrome/quinol oxidase subunit 2
MIWEFLMLVAPITLILILLFTFFVWIYKEEKRREFLRRQREEEWKREIQILRDDIKNFCEQSKGIV